MEIKRNLLGFVYVGKNEEVEDYLVPKIGQTGQTLKEREREIRRKYPSFRMMAHIVMPFSTKAEREHVESEVRVKMQKYGKNIKNDHFLVPIRKDADYDTQYMAFALIAMTYAVECCKREHYPYIVKIF